jgi:hypothetical protein
MWRTSSTRTPVTVQYPTGLLCDDAGVGVWDAGGTYYTLYSKPPVSGASSRRHTSTVVDLASNTSSIVSITVQHPTGLCDDAGVGVWNDAVVLRSMRQHYDGSKYLLSGEIQHIFIDDVDAAWFCGASYSFLQLRTLLNHPPYTLRRQHDRPNDADCLLRG